MQASGIGLAGRRRIAPGNKAATAVAEVSGTAVAGEPDGVAQKEVGMEQRA
jgi:hypothetical protein